MCTGIVLRTKNGKIIFARTLEFNLPIHFYRHNSSLFIGTVGYIPNLDKTGYVVDGVNKYGLAIGCFYFPENAEFAKNDKENKINLFTLDVGRYILENCKNINDVINLSSKLNIKESFVGKIPFSFHWLVVDKSGNCIVLEVKKEILTVYNNPYHIITNSPTFPEHVKSLYKYKNLTPLNKKNNIEGGFGTGMLGLPGDSTSISRFIRAWFFTNNVSTPKNSKNGLHTAFNILHNFDIPIGTVIDPRDGKREVTEYTVAYSVNDIKRVYAPYGYLVRDNITFSYQPVAIPYLKLKYFIIVCAIIFLITNKR